MNLLNQNSIFVWVKILCDTALGVGCAICFSIGEKVIPVAFAVLFVMAMQKVGMARDIKYKKPKGQNVIFIVVDTLRADHLGCYGYSRNTSPHIDALV